MYIARIIFFLRYSCPSRGEGTACQQKETHPCNQHPKRCSIECKTPLTFSGLEPLELCQYGCEGCPGIYNIYTLFENIRAYVHIRAYTRIYIRIHAYTCVYIRIRTYTFIYAQIYTWTCSIKSRSGGVLEWRLPTFYGCWV